MAVPYLTPRWKRRIIRNIGDFEALGLVAECYDPERDDWIIVVKYIGDVWTDGEGRFFALRGNICIRMPELEEVYRRQLELMARMSRGETSSIIWNGVKIGRWI